MPYHTIEQLHALCILLCWHGGIQPFDKADTAVTLTNIAGRTPEMSVFLLENNPNAKDIQLTDVPSLPYQTIFFKVLGVQLEVEFDEDGVGRVRFPEQPILKTI